MSYMLLRVPVTAFLVSMIGIATGCCSIKPQVDVRSLLASVTACYNSDEEAYNELWGKNLTNCTIPELLEVGKVGPTAIPDLIALLDDTSESGVVLNYETHVPVWKSTEGGRCRVPINLLAEHCLVQIIGGYLREHQLLFGADKCIVKRQWAAWWSIHRRGGDAGRLGDGIVPLGE